MSIHILGVLLQTKAAIFQLIMNVLQKLVGLTLQKTEQVIDYAQLYFSDGSILNIYNRHDLVNCTLSSIQEDQLIYAVESDDKIELKFDGGGLLSVGMTDDDYNGPEAMDLNLADGNIVVWKGDDS